MKHYLLFYTYVSDYLERRGDFRAAHIDQAWKAQARGELVLGGALTCPSDAAVFLFEAESPAAIEAFVRADPYVVNGLVASWRVREWSTVIGEATMSPLHPQSSPTRSG